MSENEQSNGLGLAGFILSIVGFVTCGLLSPIAFLLSLFGLRKEPRGFAVAGAILGGIGSCFFVFSGLAIVGTFMGFGPGVPFLQTGKTGFEASQKIFSHKAKNGALPNDEEGNAIVGQFIDGWEKPFRYKKVDDDSFSIISDGPDKQPGTADDVKLDMKNTFDSGVVQPESTDEPVIDEAKADDPQPEQPKAEQPTIEEPKAEEANGEEPAPAKKETPTEETN